MKGTFEIRNNEDGTLDEVVAKEPAFFHLEQMSDSGWWLRVDLKDGSAIVVNLWAKRAKVYARAEMD